MKTNAMHNDATLQRTMHSDVLHISSMHTNSIQSVPSDSDAAHANFVSYRSAMAPGGALRRVVLRHSLVARLTHWMNALAMSLLFVSGLQIFKAFPALYLGDTGYETSGAVFEMGADTLTDGASAGWIRIGSHRWITTGFISGFLMPPSSRDLTASQRWHLFFSWVLMINGLLYFIVGLATGHLRTLLPTRDELKPRHLLQTTWNHLRLRFPKGGQALEYNVLQKLSYLSVIGFLAPLMLLTGWAMLPGLNSFAPWLPEIFGGRQGARLVHFVTAILLALFLLVHLLALVAVGAWNEVRSMVTGRYVVQDGD
jgi:thiosulfate reductase cytochrome b subunit